MIFLIISGELNSSKPRVITSIVGLSTPVVGRLLGVGVATVPALVAELLPII